jgi:hypothetical protein
MKVTDDLEQKILKSGIFKLDDKSNPIGLINLTSKKALSVRDSNYLDIKPHHHLKSLISDLSLEIDKFCQGPKDRNLLEDLRDDFEKELISLLKDWGLSPDYLSPHYDALLKKAKKHLNKELSDYYKNIKSLDTKDTARRDAMIYWMHRAFKEYTPIKLTDINCYLAYILIACGLEKGSPQTVFSKIDRAFHRYPKSS